MTQVGGGGGNGDPSPGPCAGRSTAADRPSRHAPAAAANSGIGLFSRPAQQFARRQRIGHLFGGQFKQCEAGDSGDLGSLTDPPVMGEGIHTSSPDARQAAPPRQEGAHIPTNICSKTGVARAPSTLSVSGHQLILKVSLVTDIRLKSSMNGCDRADYQA